MPRLQRPLKTISQSSRLMDTHEVMSIPRALLPHQQLHRFPNGPSKQETPVYRNFFCAFPSKSPVNGPSPPCPPSRSPWREKPHLQGQWLIHSFISVGVPNKEPSHKKREKILNHHPQSPTWMEGLHTMGCGLVRHGDRLRHCNLYPSAMQPSA